MPTHASDKTFALAIITTLVAFGLIYQLSSTGIGSYALDDAYIVEHSVTGILSGKESRFIDSDPWDGVTSPIYVICIAILSTFLSVELAHWIISALSISALAFSFYRLCRQQGVSELCSSAISALSLTVGLTYYHLFNGLETGMAMAALAWTLVAIGEKAPPNWGFILIGLLCFIRPELAAVSAISCVYIATVRPARHINGLIISVMTFLGFCMLFYLTSGNLLPNTVSAKTYFFAEGCLPDSIRANFTLLALWSFISSLGLFSAGFVMALTSRLRLAAFFFIAVFIFAYYWKFPGALFHNDFRYLYLLLPIAVMGWASAISYPKKVVRYISYAFGMITAASLIFSIPSGLKFYESEVETLSADNRKMAEWVAENVPESSVVMVHDAGQISRIGKHPLVDLVGLKTSYSVEVHKNTTFKLCEQVPFSISHIASHFKANYLVVTSDWNQIFGLTRSLEATGWRVERADSERGNSHYQVFRIHPSS